MPTDVEEDEILEVLKDCGVREVKREVFFATTTKATKVVKEERRSTRVRLRFDSVPLSEVDLGFSEKFPVTLCFDTVMQCWCCNQFNHKAEDCRHRNNPLCRKCGESGHQAWQCSNAPRCVNCRKAHSARDPTCEVFVKYSEAYKMRQLSRIVGSYPGVRITAESHPSLPGENARAPDAATGGVSYAAATSRMTLTEEGKARCSIPVGAVKEPVKPPAAPPVGSGKKPKPASKPKIEWAGLLVKLWRQVKKCIQPLMRDFPLLAMLIPVVEACVVSPEMTTAISQVFSNLRSDDVQ